MKTVTRTVTIMRHINKKKNTNKNKFWDKVAKT